MDNRGNLSTFSPLREALGRIGNPLPWEERRAIENALLDVAEAAQELDDQQAVAESDDSTGSDFDVLYARWANLRDALKKLPQDQSGGAS